MRRAEVAKLFKFKHGDQARIAHELGVSRSTICRDVARLLEMTRLPQGPLEEDPLRQACAAYLGAA